MKKSRLVVVVAAAFLLTYVLYLYGSQVPAVYTPTAEDVEVLLDANRYESCGSYTANPGNVEIVFSKEFSGRGEVRCYLLIERPGDEYAIHKPTIEITIEPPPNSGPYQYSAVAGYFSDISRFDVNKIVDASTKWGAGTVRDRIGRPPPNPPKFDKDDVFVVIVYRPQAGGFPVKITIEFKTTVSTESQAGPVIGSPLRTTKKLAEQLGFKDVKEFMKYMGYELCGEFNANDTREMQVIRVVTEIDLNVGKACYMLIHPPPKKTFLITFSKIGVLDFIGDEQQLSKYLYAPNRMVPEILLYSPPTVVPAVSILGQGRIISPIDVPRPYENKTALTQGVSIVTNDEFLDRTPILVFFAYKGDSDAIGEPFRFRLMVETEIKFYVIPAKYGG
jgi:hypothetical protein